MEIFQLAKRPGRRVAINPADVTAIRETDRDTRGGPQRALSIDLCTGTRHLVADPDGQGLDRLLAAIQQAQAAAT